MFLFKMVSVEEYKKFYAKKPSKYRSKKVKYFEEGKQKTKDSVKEYYRGLVLKQMQREGLIFNLQESVPFLIQDRIVEKGKVVERAIKYIADYVYTENGEKIIEDVKSKITRKIPSYILKRKMVKKLYPEYKFREV